MSDLKLFNVWITIWIIKVYVFLIWLERKICPKFFNSITSDLWSEERALNPRLLSTFLMAKRVNFGFFHIVLTKWKILPTGFCYIRQTDLTTLSGHWFHTESEDSILEIALNFFRSFFFDKKSSWISSTSWHRRFKGEFYVEAFQKTFWSFELFSLDGFHFYLLASLLRSYMTRLIENLEQLD